MVKANVSAAFPSALVTRKDIGKFTNNEGVVLSQDSDSGEGTLNTVSAPSNIEADNYLFAITQDGPLLLQVTAVDANAQTVTVDRPVDGTADVDMVEGARLVAAVPARAMNRLAAEQVAMQGWLGKDGDTITWDRNLVLQPSTTDGTYPLSIEVLSGHSDPEPFIQFRRSTDGGTTYTSVGSINYDPTNDELEFHNITLTAGTAADILLEDDRSLYLGTDKDARFLYDSGDDRVEYRSDKVLRVEQADGSEALTLTPTTRLNLVGAFSIGGTDVFAADRDQAISWVPNADGTLTAGTASRRYSEVHSVAFHVENTAGDANSITQADASGYHAGAGGASALDVLLARQANSVYEVTGSLAGSVRLGMGAAGEALVALRAAAADANPYALLDHNGLAFGAGGASATDVLLSRGAANQLDLAAGDSFAIADLTQGSVLFAGANGVLSQDNTNLFWDNSNNNLGLGTNTFGTGAAGIQALKNGTGPTTSPADTVQLWSEDAFGVAGDAAFHLKTEPGAVFAIGARVSGELDLFGLGDRSDTTNKRLNLGSQHHTNAEEPVLGIRVQAQVGSNEIDIGGGNANFNSATQIGFWTAANNITTTGTRVGRFTSVGQFELPVTGSSAGLLIGDDALLFRGAANLFQLGASDHLQIPSGDLRFDDATNGVILKDSAATPHYWRITVETDGSLTTTDLGTSLPAT